MTTEKFRKMAVLTLAASLAGVGLAAGWNPATRTYDHSGYWTQLTSGTSSNPSFSHPEHWQDAETGAAAAEFKPGACLYATKAVYVNPDGSSGDGVTSSPCSVLALNGSSAALQYTCKNSSSPYFDFGSQVDMLPGAVMKDYAAYFKAKGTFNFYSTSSSPNAILIQAALTGDSHGFYFNDVTMTGDSLAYVMISADHSSCTLASFKWENGDGSQFYGTFRVANTARAPSNCVTKFKLGDIAIGGTVSMSNDTQLVLCGTSGAAISNLVMDAGAVLVGTTSARKLTVAGSVTCEDKLLIDAAELAAPSDDSAASWELVKFALTADLSDFDCGNVCLTNAVGNIALYGEVTLRDDLDGGKTLLLSVPRVVRRTDVRSNAYWRQGNADNDGYRSEFQFAQSSKTLLDFWTDGSCPNVPGIESVVYASDHDLAFPTNGAGAIGAFTGKLLDLNGCRIETAAATGGFNVPNMRLRNRCGFRLCDWAGYQDPAFKNEEGATHYTMRLQGGLDLGDSPSTTHYVEIYERRKYLRIESVVSGAGNLELQTYPSTDYTLLNAALELVSGNPDWTGKLRIKGINNDQYKEYTVDGEKMLCPNRRNTCHCRLYLENAAGLGGRRDSYAYDALELKHYGELFLRRDATLASGLNRGVSFGDYSTLNITNGLTLTILQPTTWAGTVYKAGAGRLALGGGAPKFDGALQADEPSANGNILVVEGGTIEPLDAEAFNGIEIRFSDASCCIELNADLTGTLHAKGLVDTKTDTPFVTAAADGKIRFRLKTAATKEEVQAGLTVGLCTVSQTAASALRGNIAIGRLCDVRGDVVDFANGDGSVTFAARYTRRGMILTVR